MADQCKQMKKRLTAVTDLSGDELSCIFIIVAKSGAAELARVMPVCRLFSQVGKSELVLRALNCHDFEVSIDSFKNYQQINGLISLAAEAGHSAAQYMFAKIILWSCGNSAIPIRERPYYLDLRLQEVNSIIPINVSLDKSKDQTFMSQLSSKSSCNSKGLYHYRFVKMFLSQCGPCEFNVMYYCLHCYKAYCQKDSGRSQVSLKHMWEMCIVLRACLYDLALLNYEGTHGRARALLSFEEFRSQAIQDLDDIFILNNETTKLR